MFPSLAHLSLYDYAVEVVVIMPKSKGTGRPRSCAGRMVCDNAVCHKVVTVPEGNNNAGPTMLPRIDSQVGGI